MNNPERDTIDALDIAIIGMAGQFPGAKTLEQFWCNLRDGVESIAFPTDEALMAAGVTATELADPHYVKAVSGIEDIESFDAAFFGIPPREAEIMDPQHRLFLEYAWSALEVAGYVPQGAIGVYAGANMNSYLINLYSNQDLVASLGEQITFGNSKDFLPTRISYKLNLKGPSLNIQTACSTSLVAIHVACQSLLNQECDMALAGGISIKISQVGYKYREDDIFSPDGHCRAFDASAQGTVFGSGVGIVVLKRLADAIADGDCINAVIKGSAINNDGSLKVSYTAPSVDGQAEVIVEALSAAGVNPNTITYVETHGTGTAIGDPIELQALTKAFRTGTAHQGFCAIGSVKTNFGHLVSASGVAGLIKTVLALQHKQIPPSLHFKQPNPQIDFVSSPFYVNTQLSDWNTNGTPRRAGVSSFGMGGTNAHVILQEAPPVITSGSSRPWQLLLLSAKTNTALDAATVNLANHLQQHPDLNLADLAYTLQVGRKAFNHRRTVVCQTLEDGAKALFSLDPQRVFTQNSTPGQRQIIFMFPGQGAQSINMGRELYETEPTFREQVDRCCELLKPHLELDLRSIIYPDEERRGDTEARGHGDIENLKLTQNSKLKTQNSPPYTSPHTQPALFVIEYALAQLWISWGVKPEAMIGYSVGEYVAATLAGVFALEDALALVTTRGRLMDQLPTGVMLSEQSILESFAATFQTIKLNPPKLPLIANISGHWVTNDQAIDPDYWMQHLRQLEQFSEGIAELLKQPQQILLEMGSGQTFSTFTKHHQVSESIVLTSLRHPQDQRSDSAFLLQTLGQLWLKGVPIAWSEFYAHEHRQRVPLPTYPFERQRYWIERQASTNGASPTLQLNKNPNLTDWFYVPIWKQSVLSPSQQRHSEQSLCTLVFVDECGLGDQLVNRLERKGRSVTIAKIGSAFHQIDDRTYIINPQYRNDYNQLLSAMVSRQQLPNTIIHLWSVTSSNPSMIDFSTIDRIQITGFYSLLFLAQSLGKQSSNHKFSLTVISNNMQVVTGEEVHCPEKATLLGPINVIAQEYPNITTRSVDITLPQSGSLHEQKLIDALLTELKLESSDRVIAYRGQHRWVQTFEPLPLETVQETPRLRNRGTYLITGGLGGVGLILAKHLAQTVQARLILIGRSAFPTKHDWVQWVQEHDELDQTSHKIRELQTLEQYGAEVLVLTADVTNLVEMQAAIAQSLAQFGVINGVIHAAGVSGGGVIQGKTVAMSEAVLAPKVKGTIVLDRVCQAIPLDFFILCSSLNAIVGGVGQVDYCAANAFLDAFAAAKTQRDGTFTLSINWDAWDAVGMTALQPRFRPVSALPDIPLRAIHHPLLDHCVMESAEQAVYTTQLNVSKHWVLNEHRIKGTAVLVGTAYLEMVRAAFADYARTEAIVIHDVYFLNPLVVSDGESKLMQLRFQKQGDGFEFVILSQSDPASEQWQEHSKGIVSGIIADTPKIHDLHSLKVQCNQQTIMVTQEEKHESHTEQARLAAFGPRWTNLKQIHVGQHQAFATLELPEAFVADTDTYSLHPALLDLATGFMRRLYGGMYLPFSYKKLTVKGALPQKIYSYVQAVDRQENHTETLTFNVVVMDEQGRELVKVDAFTMRKVDGDRFATRASSELFKTPVSPTENAIAQRRMSSTEGVEVFRRVLQGNWTQILVSTRDLQAVMAQKQSFVPLQAIDTLLDRPRPTHPRLLVGTTYVAPSQAIEQTIANIWQKFLGVEPIGIHDHFFELGGDSLLATQVISAMRQAFNVDLPLHSLFELPTIAAQATTIQQLQDQSTPNPISIIPKLDRSEAQATLENLDQLSEADLDALLNQLLLEAEVKP